MTPRSLSQSQSVGDIISLDARPCSDDDHAVISCCRVVTCLGGGDRGTCRVVTKHQDHPNQDREEDYDYDVTIST